MQLLVLMCIGAKSDIDWSPFYNAPVAGHAIARGRVADFDELTHERSRPLKLSLSLFNVEVCDMFEFTAKRV